MLHQLAPSHRISRTRQENQSNRVSTVGRSGPGLRPLSAALCAFLFGLLPVPPAAISAGSLPAASAAPQQVLRDTQTGLAGHYLFDGNGEDASGNRRNASFSGAATVSDRHGNENRALRFTGGSAFFDDNFDGLAQATFSLWIKPVAGAFQTLVAKYNSSDNNPLGFASYLTENGTLYFSVHDASDRRFVVYSTNAGNLTPDAWNHLVFTFDGAQSGTGKIGMYVNGNAIATFVERAQWDPANLPDNSDLFALGYAVGSTGGTTPALQADLDDFRVYNRALSASEIRDLNAIEAPIPFHRRGLILHLPFTGGQPADSSDQRLTVINRGTRPAMDRAGRRDQAVRMERGRYIETVSSPALNVEAYTLSLWFKRFRTGTDVEFISSRSTEVMEIHTGGASGNNGLRFIPAPGVYIDSDPEVFRTYDWNHVSLVYNPAARLALVYLNGVRINVKVTSGDLGTPVPALNDPLLFGMRGNLSNPLFGNIDNVRLYNRALPESELQALHQLDMRDPTRDELVFMGSVELGRAMAARVIQPGDSLHLLAFTPGIEGMDSPDGPATFIDRVSADKTLYEVLLFTDNVVFPADTTIYFKFALRNRTRTIQGQVSSPDPRYDAIAYEAAPGTGEYGNRATRMNGGAGFIATGPGFWNNESTPIETPPTLISPANQARETDRAPVLTWNHLQYAVSYQVQVAESPDFGTLVVDSTMSGLRWFEYAAPQSLKMRQGKLEANRTYHWRVRAYYPSGGPVTSFSSSFEFTTGDAVDLNANLVAFYPFNGTVNDISGYGNHPTLVGARLSPDRFEADGNAAYFDGTPSSKHTIGFLPGLEQAEALTISLWIRKQMAGEPGGWAGKWETAGNPANSFLLYNGETSGIDRGAFMIQLSDQGSYRVDGNSVIPAGVWTHVAAVWNGRDGTLRLFKNGVLDAASATPAGQKLNLNRTFEAGLGFWGGLDQANTMANARLDEVRIYRRALRSNEIDSLFRLESAQTQAIETVWPGDTDRNGFVNAADLIPIARFYDATGPGAAANLEWKSSVRTPWLHFHNAAAAQHADADGNGRVDAFDLLALGRNYGRITGTPEGFPKSKTADSIAITVLLKPVSASTTRIEILRRPGAAVRALALSLEHPAFSQWDAVPRLAGGPAMFREGLEVSGSGKGRPRLDLAVTALTESVAGSETLLAAWEINETLTDVSTSPGIVRVAVLNSQGAYAAVKAEIRMETATANNAGDLPDHFDLESNYPNPFNPETVIPFALSEAGHVTLEILDLQGRVLQTLISRALPAGRHRAAASMDRFASGLYFYRLRVQSQSGTVYLRTRKMMLIK